MHTIETRVLRSAESRLKSEVLQIVYDVRQFSLCLFVESFIVE